MLRTFISIFFLQLFTWNVSAQTNIQFEQLSIQDIQTLEQELASTFIDTTELTINRNPLDESPDKIKTIGLIYERPNQDFPLALNVWYLFEPNQSTTSAIRYYWGLYNPSFNANENRDLLTELNTKESEFQQLFERLYSQVKEAYGEPTKQLINIDKPHRLTRNIVWESTSEIIQLEIDFSRQIQEFPGIGLQTNKFEITLTTRKNAM
jgi:hypothetical protein